MRDERSAAAPVRSISDWAGLCRAGGIAAYILIAYCLFTMVQLLSLGGPPSTAAEAFRLLQGNRVAGLLRLDLPTMFAIPLYYPLFLGLFAALRRTDFSKALLSTSLAFVGVTLSLATPGALSMLSLSDRHATAVAEAARAQLEAAGDAVLASDVWHGTGSFVGGTLAQIGAVLICIVMLRSGVFGRVTAWLGILMHGLDLAHIVLALPAPTAGFVLMAVAGPLYPVWFFLVGRTLLRVARQVPGGFAAAAGTG